MTLQGEEARERGGQVGEVVGSGTRGGLHRRHALAALAGAARQATRQGTAC